MGPDQLRQVFADRFDVAVNRMYSDNECPGSEP